MMLAPPPFAARLADLTDAELRAYGELVCTYAEQSRLQRLTRLAELAVLLIALTDSLEE